MQMRVCECVCVLCVCFRTSLIYRDSPFLSSVGSSFVVVFFLRTSSRDSSLFGK